MIDTLHIRNYSQLFAHIGRNKALGMLLFNAILTSFMLV